MNRYATLLCSSTLFLLIFGCRKFVEVPPPITQVSSTSLFSNNATLESALGGIYITMEGNSVGGGPTGISAILGLSGDDFNLFPGTLGDQADAYMNQETSIYPPTIWSDLYKVIYQANAIITGANNSTAITMAVRQQAVGEAEFLRAFCNFYLVNIYGNIPLVLTTDYNTNSTLGQSPPGEVYAQIVADLEDAKNRLGQNYLDAQGNVTNERVRPNALAAAALLARAYLYMHKYDSAEQEATTVINSSIYQLYQGIEGLNSVFLTTSQEAIWQLELPASDVVNTPDGGAFLLGLLYFGGPNTNAPFTLSDSLIASFEPNDLRRTEWVDSVMQGTTTYYFPYKYKHFYDKDSPPTEYPTIMRLGEQFLIRAEARAQQGNLAQAILDLDTIRSRAGLPLTTASTQINVLSAILHERRVELFTEYGHRWFDLKRTGTIDSVMSVVTPLKGGGTWSADDSLYPIPYGDLQTDPKLKQNPGYN